MNARAAFAAILLISTPYASSAQQAIPQKAISFQKGASSATVKGTLKGEQTIDYTINARAGQTLSVKLVTSNGANYFNLIKPSERDVAFFMGEVNGNSFTGPLPESGNTKIRVYLMRSAARRNEAASFTLTVGVTGHGAGSAASSDAKVAGTRYNATADVPCKAAAGAKMGVCKGGVMRMAGGEATVELATPDGGMRHIYFKDGRAVSSDARTGNFRVERQGDTSVIRIGEYETYRIADAFVLGG